MGNLFLIFFSSKTAIPLNTTELKMKKKNWYLLGYYLKTCVFLPLNWFQN